LRIDWEARKLGLTSGTAALAELKATSICVSHSWPGVIWPSHDLNGLIPHQWIDKRQQALEPLLVLVTITDEDLITTRVWHVATTPYAPAAKLRALSTSAFL
jgi:hypothetical protein